MAGASITRSDVQGKPLAADLIRIARAWCLSANPFVTDDGKASFFAFGGAYQITATRGAFEDTQNYVAIGRGSETDLSVVTPRGLSSAATSLQRWRSRHAYGCRYRAENLHLIGGWQPQSHSARCLSDLSIPRSGCSRRASGLKRRKRSSTEPQRRPGSVATLHRQASQRVNRSSRPPRRSKRRLQQRRRASASVSPALRYIFDTGLSGVSILSTEFRTNNVTT